MNQEQRKSNLVTSGFIGVTYRNMGNSKAVNRLQKFPTSLKSHITDPLRQEKVLMRIVDLMGLMRLLDLPGLLYQEGCLCLTSCISPVGSSN